MYQYNIRENGFIIGRVKGKKKAFEFINTTLKRDSATGFWIGFKCVSSEQNKEYTIQRAN